MKLTEELVQAAAFGGAVLGGGGGGQIEMGLCLGRLALQAGQPHLVSLDELEDQATLVTVSAVGAPSAKDQYLEPKHHVQALQLLISHLDTPVSGLITNENGGLATLNGWFQSAVTGLPVVNAACNGRAHPTGLMGAMGLNTISGYISLQAVVGGSAEAGRHLRLYIEGDAGTAARFVRQAAVEAGGMVAVARNPVPVAYARDNAAVGALQQALTVGQAFLAAGNPHKAAEAACQVLGGEVVCRARVVEISLRSEGGFDLGQVSLEGGYELTFWNEFITLEKHGQRLATFPDLITALSTTESRPLSTAELRKGQDLLLIRVPHRCLRLGSGMRQPELFDVVEKAVGKDLVGHIFS